MNQLLLVLLAALHFEVMPPKTKRQKVLGDNIAKARGAKQRLEAGQETSMEQSSGPSKVSCLFELLAMSDSALDTDNESVDPSFSLDDSMKSDTDYFVDNFCEEWVIQLDRDDKVSLGLFGTGTVGTEAEAGLDEDVEKNE